MVPASARRTTDTAVYILVVEPIGIWLLGVSLLVVGLAQSFAPAATAISIVSLCTAKEKLQFQKALWKSTMLCNFSCRPLG